MAKTPKDRPREDTRGEDGRTRITPTEARQGKIVLDSKRKKTVFLLALLVAVLAALVYFMMFR